MEVRVLPFSVRGEVVAPPSKSIAQRLLICAALSEGKTVVDNVGDSDDVKVVAENLVSLGVNVSFDGGRVVVERVGEFNRTAKLNFRESGFAMRSLLPVACAIGVAVEYTTDGKLGRRPIDALFLEMSRHGAIVNGGRVEGRLEVGDYVVDCSESSQYFSGLILASSYLDGVSTVRAKNRKVGFGYVDATIQALRLFGVKCEKSDDTVTVHGGTFSTPGRVVVEGDFSSVAPLLALAAIGGEVTVKGLNFNSNQPDRAIIDILKDYGADVSVNDDCVTVKRGERRAIDFSCENSPDLALIVATLAAFADGTSVIRGTARLRGKESDREEGVIRLLASAGIEARLERDSIYVRGGKPRRGTFDFAKDHRYVMAATVLASGADGESVIRNAEHVAKSYPGFFDVVKEIGGDLYVDIRR